MSFKDILNKMNNDYTEAKKKRREDYDRLVAEKKAQQEAYDAAHPKPSIWWQLFGYCSIFLSIVPGLFILVEAENIKNLDYEIYIAKDRIENPMIGFDTASDTERFKARLGELKKDHSSAVKGKNAFMMIAIGLFAYGVYWRVKNR